MSQEITKTCSMCSCFRNLITKRERLPNIAHVPVQGDLQPVKLDEASRPDDERLNFMFSSLVDELGVPESGKQAMMNFSADKKWQIYCSRIQDIDSGRTLATPEEFLSRLKEVKSFKDVDELRTALRTQTVSFIARFLELNGIDLLLGVIRQLEIWQTEDIEKINHIHLAVVGCVKALLNVADGRSYMLAHPTAIACLARGLRSDNVHIKINVLEILAPLCLVPGGHRKVLQALYAFSRWANERTRFQTLVFELSRKWNDPYLEIQLKTAIMSLVNAVIKYGAGEKHLEFRLHIRFELLMLGIEPAIEALYHYNDEILEKHADFFVTIRQDDELKFAEKFESKHIDCRSATSIFELLRKRMTLSPAYPYFVSILFHLTHIVASSHGPSWALIDRIISQVILQSKEGDPDHASLEINVANAIKNIVSEGEMKNLKKEIRNLEKEKDNLDSVLAGKEREIESKTLEIEEMANILQMMKADLEKEKSAREELENKLNSVLNGNTGLVLQNGSNSSLNMALQNQASKLSSISPSNQAPPPAPPMGIIPPPPPPPPPGMPMGGQLEVQRKGPRPNQPLKSFNWIKLSNNQIQNTIWKELKEDFTLLDLEELDKNFSAYQHIQQNGSGDTIRGKSSLVVRELSVIDGRRAQNCSILLSKLKMSNEDLAYAIRNVDPRESLAKDMCEQLLKFVPTAEEKQMLAEHCHEIDQMASTDRFLYEMSLVDHYEEKLKALCYRKKFNERVTDLKTQLEFILSASKQVEKSRKLQKLLCVVLALGNYMNKGNRGNAAGFRLVSLNKLVDTKSSENKRITLLIHLLETLNLKRSNILDLQADLAATKEASKVLIKELNEEIHQMKIGLKEIEKEIDYDRKSTNRGSGISTSSNNGDLTNSSYNSNNKFSSIMASFATVANYKLKELDDLEKQTKSNYERVCKYFAEEDNMPDEFFKIFDTFLNCITESGNELGRINNEKEILEKKRLYEISLQGRKNSRTGVSLGLNRESNSEVLEFDQLLSNLRSGSAYNMDGGPRKKPSNRHNRERVT